MSNLFTERVLNMTAVTPQPEDYMGEDGLLYCGKCHTPKEAYFPEKQAALFGRDRHPAECDCQKAQRLEREAAEQRRKHLDTVEDLKRRGFTNPTMQGLSPTTTGNARKWRLHTSMWSIGKSCARKISAICYGARSAQEKAILPVVSLMPSWSRKSLSA